VAGPTARHAHRCPSDAGLARSLAYLGPRAARLSSAQVQELAQHYFRAREALWASILARTQPEWLEACGRELGGFWGGASWSALVGHMLRLDVGLRITRAAIEGESERFALRDVLGVRERLGEANVGLASDFARAHRGAGSGHGRGLVLVAPGDDALQSAMEHTLRAIDMFDPRRGLKLSTYVAYHAYRGVQLERLRAGRVRLNQTALARWADLQAAEQALAHELGREPTDEELQALMGSAARLRTARAAEAVLHARSLDEPRRDEDGAEYARDMGGAAESPEDAALDAERLARARRVADAAAPPGSRERLVADAVAEGGPREGRKVAGGARAADEALGVVRRRKPAREEVYEGEPVKPRSPFRPVGPTRVERTTVEERPREVPEEGAWGRFRGEADAIRW